MARLQDIINPPNESTTKEPEQLYRHMESVNQYLEGLVTIANPAQTINSDFSTLGPGGLTPVTQVDGDNTAFSSNWFVVGASVATYTITPTIYPGNSPIISASDQFINIVASAYSGNGLYFYQRQAGMVRKFQSQSVTNTIHVQNNTSNVVRVRFDLDFFLDPGDILLESGTLYLQPGFNQLSATLKTPSLRDKVVGAAAYIEFQLVFLSTPEDLDIYSLKSEFGTISTPLN